MWSSEIFSLYLNWHLIMLFDVSFPFWILVWGQPSWCSGLYYWLCSQGHSWWGSRDHMGCQGLNPGWPYARQTSHRIVLLLVIVWVDGLWVNIEIVFVCFLFKEKCSFPLGISSLNMMVRFIKGWVLCNLVMKYVKMVCFYGDQLKRLNIKN